MNAQKIWLPTDFSHTADAALTYAAALAKESGGQLVIAHAHEPPLAYGGELSYAIPEPTSEGIDAYVARG